MAEETKIDENLYSRQLGVFGHETMGKLIKMEVLVVGMTGLGVETAKNLVLAGPKAVTLYDPTPCQQVDRQRNFYVMEDHVKAGVSRADASAPKLQELNSYVRLDVLADVELSEAVLERFHAVVFTGAATPPASVLARLDAFCHAHSPPIAFVSAAVRGAAGYAFVDFGPEHRVHDTNGEAVLSAIVTKVDVAGDVATVVTHDGKRHGLTEGDHVVFREVEGAVELNDGEPRVVGTTTPFTFELSGCGALSPYTGGGVVEQVKVPTVVRHHTLADRSLTPVTPGEDMMITPDFGRFDRPPQLHLAFLALDKWVEESNGGKLPALRAAADADAVVAVAEALVKAHGETLRVESVDETVVRSVVSLAAAELPALAAFFGGVVAQEVVKVTGKFTPLSQHLYWDAFDSLPADLSDDEVAATGSKYDDLVAMFGKTLMAKLAAQRVFLVGAGALGCEFLKNFAMMGMSCGGSGRIVVTDMDKIEVSNLNRQFLFRPENVGAAKSTTAAEAAAVMNPDLNVESTEVPVGHDTEATFDDEFWMGLDLVTNALDNLKARLYVDGRCVHYRLPLMESGTLGTKANTQVIAPFKTESYGDSVDPPEDSIPMCTLRNFPHQIEHCIEWGRDLFEGCFVTSVQDAAAFARDPPAWLAKAAAESNPSQKKAQLQGVVDAVKAAKDRSFGMCVRMARQVFHTNFHLVIRQLLHNFPVDYVNASGVKFWSGPKRPPTAAEFDADDELHQAFIVAASHLFAANFGVDLPANAASVDVLRPLLAAAEAHMEPFAPKKVRIKSGDDDDTTEGGDDDEEVAAKLLTELQGVAADAALPTLTLVPAEFEKDDDTNHHIDFVTAVSNLRARNYKIEEATKHRTKMIAGKIVPAIATTTAMITGLVCVEMYKVLQGAELEKLRNSFCNLAMNIFNVSEPMPPKKFVSKDYDVLSAGPVRAMPEGFTPWDRIEIREGSLTCGELVKLIEDKYGLDTQMVSAGPMMLYAPLMYASHRRERTDKPLKEVYETVTKTPLPPKRTYIMLDLTVCDDASDVIIPPVQFFFA